MAKLCVLLKKCLNKQIGNGLWESNGHVTVLTDDLRSQNVTPKGHGLYA